MASQIDVLYKEVLNEDILFNTHSSIRLISISVQNSLPNPGELYSAYTDKWLIRGHFMICIL